MTRQSMGISDAVSAYLHDHGLREHPVLRQMRLDTQQHPRARNQMAPEQAQWLAMMARLLGAQRYLEMGVFAGYSALSVALALPPSGRVDACDCDAEILSVAEAYWHSAGVADKINSVVSPAADFCRRLLEEGRHEYYDMILIDANKKTTDLYFEFALQLCRPGGLIVVDDVLQGGRVIAPKPNDWCAQVMAEFNTKRRRDQRVELCVLPLGDGVSIMIKR
jgi:predicted O-methyltransferase YrrM